MEEAADDLLARVLVLVMAFRSGIGTVSSEIPDPALLHFLYKLGKVAAAGGDIRAAIRRGDPASVPRLRLDATRQPKDNAAVSVASLDWQHPGWEAGTRRRLCGWSFTLAR